MKMEVFRIEQYVDMVLTYLRMGSATSDYAFRICSLEEIVRQAVRKYSQMFIMTRTRLHLEIQDQKILTDEKWLTFVIEQILSNAVKYARGGEISIYKNSGNRCRWNRNRRRGPPKNLRKRLYRLQWKSK